MNEVAEIHLLVYITAFFLGSILVAGMQETSGLTAAIVTGVVWGCCSFWVHQALESSRGDQA